jgi:hypothetical protein
MGSVKNVEIVNIYNIDGGANLADASKFVGVTQLWQHGYANDVTNLAVGTTAGFKTTQNNNLFVEGAATAASVAVALNAVEDGFLGNGNQMTLSVLGNALNTVNVSGSIAPVTTPGTFRTLSLDVYAGKDQKTVTVNTAIDASVSVYQSSPTPVNTLDFTGSAGSVTFFGDQNTTTINSGAGNDKINVATKTAKDDAATAANETITATTTTKDFVPAVEQRQQQQPRRPHDCAQWRGAALLRPLHAAARQRRRCRPHGTGRSRARVDRCARQW